MAPSIRPQRRTLEGIWILSHEDAQGGPDRPRWGATLVSLHGIPAARLRDPLGRAHSRLGDHHVVVGF